MRAQLEQGKQFLQEVSQELRRITWPTPRELVGATTVVIITTLINVLLLAFYDMIIRMVLGAVGVMR